MTQLGKGSVKKSKPSYAYAIIGVALVLFILGILGWIVINANKLGQYFKENVEVRVYLRENASERDINALKKYISEKPYTKTIDFVTKEDAKQKYLQDGNQDWVGVLESNPLPASINFKLKSDYVVGDTLSKIQGELLKYIAVSDVQYPLSLVDNLNQNVRKIGIILLSIALLLCIVAIILIDNTIRLAMFSNRFLIKTMQMVGATRWFISKPMDLRALGNGLLSGLISIGGLIGVILYAEKQLPELKTMRDNSVVAMLFLIIIFIGMMISLLSTHRSVIKYLKMKLDDLY